MSGERGVENGAYVWQEAWHVRRREVRSRQQELGAGSRTQ